CASRGPACTPPGGATWIGGASSRTSWWSPNPTNWPRGSTRNWRRRSRRSRPTWSPRTRPARPRRSGNRFPGKLLRCCLRGQQCLRLVPELVPGSQLQEGAHLDTDLQRLRLGGSRRVVFPLPVQPDLLQPGSDGTQVEEVQRFTLATHGDQFA